MYQNNKTYIKQGSKGVKRGENLSQFLFSLFLNDLEDFFSSNNMDSLENVTDVCQESLHFLYKIVYNFVC